MHELKYGMFVSIKCVYVYLCRFLYIKVHICTVSYSYFCIFMHIFCISMFIFIYVCVYYRVLMNTVYYIEESVMQKDIIQEDQIPSESTEIPSEMDVYLFVWDRFRMIAKDFILQLDSNDSTIHTLTHPTMSVNSNSAISVNNNRKLTFLLRYSKLDESIDTINERVNADKLCIECHERMCRWHIMMEHHMAHNGMYLSYICLYMYLL